MNRFPERTVSIAIRKSFAAFDFTTKPTPARKLPLPRQRMFPESQRVSWILGQFREFAGLHQVHSMLEVRYQAKSDQVSGFSFTAFSTASSQSATSPMISNSGRLPSIEETN